jgi:hypothetical protein
LDAIGRIKRINNNNHQYDDTPLMYEIMKENSKEINFRNNTFFQLNNHNYIIIHQHTGFKSVNCLVCFLLIVKNQNIKELMRTKTLLTWFSVYCTYWLFGDKAPMMVFSRPSI